MARKKVIYISGPITGVPEYYKAFEQMEDDIFALDYISLSPSRLPEEMTTGQYMRICFAMIDAADGVIFLPGWQNSVGSRLEREYCLYTNKPIFKDLAFLVEALR